MDAYQPCLYGTTGKPAYSAATASNLLNQEIGSGSKAEEDIADLFNIWLAKQEDARHKPPTLHEKLLRRCSKPGDAVMNLYADAGALLIACEQLQRICYAIEPDPKLCDVILARYEALTGNKGVKL